MDIQKVLFDDGWFLCEGYWNDDGVFKPLHRLMKLMK